ncbi:MAG: poly-gamma-glutamate system protein [Candidatus Aerophobetes bacterium]|nr:poly-gamma-glutamate system protein [Candidatus Aerophobetes bacterium]
MLYWKKSKIKPILILIIFCISRSGLLIVENTKSLTQDSSYLLKVKASQIMKSSMEVIRDYRIKKGMKIDKRVDPNFTGLIGEELTKITTTLGSLSAKRTATNPNFAALLVDMFLKAGLKRGDVIAIGVSGSFPPLILASLSAAKALDLRPITIYSVGSSAWGANNPEITWLDMEDLLNKKGLLPYRTVAASIGGGEDIGKSLSEKGKEIILSIIRRNKLPLIREDTLEKSIQRRLEIYNEYAEGDKIKLFVNIGGASANFGESSDALKIPNGLNKSLKIPHQSNQGIIYEMAKKGIPVIHLLYIRTLAVKNGLPIDPIPLPKVGEGRIYYKTKYSRTSIIITLGTIMGLLLIFRYKITWK